MAREMYLVGVSEEELKPPPKPEAPKTPKGKWENFWYHYKWVFWGCLFAAVVLVVLIVQMVSVNEPDYQILLITEDAYMDSQLDPLEDVLETYGRDLDEDGEVEVQIINCYLGSKNSSTYYANYQVLQTRLMTGEIMLFMWEPAYYDVFMETISNVAAEDYQFLTPLELEDTLEDGTLWNWASSTYRADNELLQLLPKDLYFGVRNAIGTAEGSQDLHGQVMELLVGFATGVKPETASE